MKKSLIFLIGLIGFVLTISSVIAGECNDNIDNDGDGLIDWEYDLETNTYKRKLAGEDHNDRNTDEQIAAGCELAKKYFLIWKYIVKTMWTSFASF